MEATSTVCKFFFLNAVIEEEVYIEQSLGFEAHDKETHVCILKKSISGLKQAPREWYGRIDGFLMNLVFTKSKVDFNLYYKVENEGIMILLLYVSNLFFIGKENLVRKCKKNLATEFEMKDLGRMHYFLGIEVW